MTLIILMTVTTLIIPTTSTTSTTLQPYYQHPSTTSSPYHLHTFGNRETVSVDTGGAVSHFQKQLDQGFGFKDEGKVEVGGGMLAFRKWYIMEASGMPGLRE